LAFLRIVRLARCSSPKFLKSNSTSFEEKRRAGRSELGARRTCRTRRLIADGTLIAESRVVKSNGKVGLIQGPRETAMHVGFEMSGVDVRECGSAAGGVPLGVQVDVEQGHFSARRHRR
jgi:hypothetical protein